MQAVSQHITLRDGRKLWYAWFGAGADGQPAPAGADGPPALASTAAASTARPQAGQRTVVYLHGFPSSRLEGGLLHEDARHLGIRVLALDRPGAGGSTFNPRQTVESTAEDVRELMDQLHLRTAIIMGASGGSPFACACAALLGERAEALLLVCPLAPAHDRDADLLAGVSASNMRLVHSARRHPWRLWATLHVVRLIQKVPHGNLLLHASGFAEVDKRAMEQYPASAAIEKAAVREGLAQGVAGALRDLQLFYAEPPSVDLASIRCTTVIWQGDLDTTTPPAMARHYADSIPGAQLHVMEGEGHLSLPFGHNRKILTSAFQGSQETGST